MKELRLSGICHRGPAGAYALIFSSDEKLLTIEANGGRRYLPGGRLEAGERPEEALLREVMEECGCEAEILAKLGEADQLVEGGLHSIRAHYFQAMLTSAMSRGEHPAVWMQPDQAVASMHRRSDAWAIGRAMDLKRSLEPPICNGP